ncbi:hypothetical protein GCM10009551_075390 [Nocardiopsis tropica]
MDADDPQERADLVDAEAVAAAIFTGDGLWRAPSTKERAAAIEAGTEQPGNRLPTPADDSWIIFTSGSTGTPKGVAVTNRNSAAFVDAEARLFLQDEPLKPGDRVLAGLSVAFDAGEHLRRVRSGHVLHRDPQPAVVLAPVVQVDDVAVVELGQQIGLALEAGLVLGVAAHRGVQQFERVLAGQPGVLHEVHLTHAATAQAAHHAVSRDVLLVHPLPLRHGQTVFTHPFHGSGTP